MKQGGQALQDKYLNQLRKESILTTIFLTNGFQLRGKITSFDSFTVLIVDGDKKQQLVFKHAISTFLPQRNITLDQE